MDKSSIFKEFFEVDSDVGRISGGNLKVGFNEFVDCLVRGSFSGCIFCDCTTNHYFISWVRVSFS